MSYRVPDHVHHSSVHDEVIILDGKTNAYFGLNGTASVVWGVLAGGGSVDAATDSLATTYAVDPTLARADVEALVRQFLGRGVLVPEPAAS